MTLCQPANHRALPLPAKTAAYGWDKTGERFQQRGFAAAVGPNNGGHAAAFNDARKRARDGLVVVTRNQFIHHDHGNATAQRTARPRKTISTSASKSRTGADREKRDVDISAPIYML